MKGNTVWEHKHSSSNCTWNASSTGWLAPCQPIGWRVRGLRMRWKAGQKAKHWYDRWWSSWTWMIKTFTRRLLVYSFEVNLFQVWPELFCLCTYWRCRENLALPSHFFLFMLVSSVASQVLLCTTSCSRARSPVADDMKATRGTPCPSAGLTGVSACNYILTEVYSGRGQQRQMKACQTLSRAC